MKKLLVLALVLGFLLAMVTPIAASGAGGTRLNGEITDIDETAQQITILVTSGNDYVGDEKLIQVTHKTSLCEWQVDGCTPITFDDLVVGDRVGVTGQFVGDILYAKKIVVH